MILGDQRDRYRRVFVEAWRKHSAGEALEPLEHAIVAIIDAHPEYQEILTQSDVLVRDYSAADGDANPFLHMGMHVTIVEQITSDRPAGVRALYDELRRRFPDTHTLEHAMMRCLGESLLEAREKGTMPDEQRYLTCLRGLL